MSELWVYTCTIMKILRLSLKLDKEMATPTGKTSNPFWEWLMILRRLLIQKDDLLRKNFRILFCINQANTRRSIDEKCFSRFQHIPLVKPDLAPEACRSRIYTIESLPKLS